MALPTTYNAGTATIAANDTAVTGQNTTWSTSGIQAGDMFMAAGLSVPIASVNSNTSITLADPWPGAARNTASYRIAFTPDAQRVLASTRAVLDALTNGVLYAIAGLATAADKIAYFTGQGTAALASFTAYARSLVASADAGSARTTLGLGSAALANTGTSGANVPLLNGANTWSGTQTFGDGTAAANVVVNGAAGSNRNIFYRSAGSNRWSASTNTTAESGGNVGSDFQINRYSDAGAVVDTPFAITRSTGIVTLSQGLGFTGSAAATTRTNMGLGTAAVENIGTSGNAIGKMNAANTWSAPQTISTGASQANFNLDANAGQSRVLFGFTAGVTRWAVLPGDSSAETGSNIGSNFGINRYADNGSYLDTPLVIARSTGVVSFVNAPKIPSFTVSTLPSAAANPQGIAYVSNGTSNKRLAISDGSSWRFPDGAVVS